MAEELKKKKRGITDETRVTAVRKFHEKDAAPCGLFIGALSEVKCEWSINAEGKQFGGMNCPRLSFYFVSNHAVDEQRHVNITLFPVESNVETIIGGKNEWQVNNLFGMIKYLLNFYYLKGRKLTEEEENLLCLPFEDIDDDGAYVPLDQQEVLNGYGTLFQNVASIFEGKLGLKDGETPKPIYKDQNGNLKKVWMKLLRHKKIKGNWTNVGQDGELAFEKNIFSSTGFLEEFKQDKPQPTSIRLDMSKESIVPQDIKKAPNIDLGMMEGLGSIPMSDSNNSYNGGGMPF